MSLTLDPRSTSIQVHAWLAHDLTDAALRSGLAVLAADPNWLLRQRPGPTSWDLALCYSPEGPWQSICLRRRAATAGAGLWHRIP